MSLFTQWKDLAYRDRDQESYNAFWGDYLPKEQAIYETILSSPETIISDSIAALAERYEMDHPTFIGFMDGINSSLKESADLDTLEADSIVSLDIDLEKLYYNMLDAKADWLYTLPQWDELLSQEKRKEIKKTYNATKIVVKDKKVGRNEPCPCGSGRKYKQCCLNKE